MRKIEAVLIVVIILGCTVKEEPLKTFTALQITEDNVFSYSSVQVKVNPNLDYLNISGNIKKNKKWNDPTKRKFHIFTRPGINKIVLLEMHTRNRPHTFQGSIEDLTKNMAVIQKGSKPIAGRTWEIFTRALPEFPEYILSAISQKGISIEQYGCGLEIGVATTLDRFSRIYISYIKGIEECQSLPQNGSILSHEQLSLIQEFVNQFDEDITISDHSGGS